MAVEEMEFQKNWSQVMGQFQAYSDVCNKSITSFR